MAGPPTLPTLKRLLEAAGYRVEVRPEAVVAVRSEDHRVVVLDRARRSPSELEPLCPADAVRRTVVYELDPGEAARESAAERGMEVLGPSTLGPALGEILLPSPRAGSEPAAAELESDPLEAPFPVLPSEARIVRPRIDRQEAEERAALREARYTLRLVPYFVGAYRVRTVAPDGGAGPVSHRLVAVNATTRVAEIWEEGDRELDEEIAGPAQRLLPQLSLPLAQSLAVDAVRRHHAGRVDHTEQHAGALVIESRRVMPALADVRLGPMTVLYVPFWFAEGAGGRVVLDAVSGQGARAFDPEPDRPSSR